MPYIGQQPTNVAFLTDQFSGNGSTTAFTLSAAPANTSSILVAISGVLQDPSTYSVSGTTLTFSPAPPSGTGNISVRFLGIPASGVTTTAYRTVTEFTATAGQTTFSVPSYTPGFIDVYRNGVMLGSADYTASNGVSVVLVNACTVGDLVQTISMSVSSVLNAVQSTGGTIAGQLNINAPTGQNPLIVQNNGTEAMRVNSSGNVGIGTSSPSGRLDVNTGTGANFRAIFAATNQVEVSNYSTASGYREMLFAGSPLTFYTGTAGGVATTERMRIDSSGNLLVGTTSQASTARFTVKSANNGYGGIGLVKNDTSDYWTQNIDSAVGYTWGKNGSDFWYAGRSGSNNCVSVNGSWVNSSDSRLKENISPLTNSLSKVLQLQGVSFDRINSGQHEIGLIAQDVEKVYPECVEVPNSEDEFYALNYGALVAPLIEAIKEQQQIIEDLKARIEVLEAK